MESYFIILYREVIRFDCDFFMIIIFNQFYASHIENEILILYAINERKFEKIIQIGRSKSTSRRLFRNLCIPIFKAFTIYRIDMIPFEALLNIGNVSGVEMRSFGIVLEASWSRVFEVWQRIFLFFFWVSKTEGLRSHYYAWILFREMANITAFGCENKA